MIKKLMMALAWLALGILIGSALEALVGAAVAIIVLVVISVLAFWNLIKEEV